MPKSNEFPEFGIRFNANIGEVRLLTELNSKKVRSDHGGPHKIEILNKSAIVLITTCWEAFIEDLVTCSFNFMIINSESPDVFPRSVQVLASKSLRENKNEHKVWDLAGDGWREVLRAYAQNEIKKLNTPSSGKIDDLLDKVIGVSNFSKQWRWQGVTNARAISRLDKLVSTRGEIAHRLSADTYIKKSDVDNAMKLVINLAVICSNGMRNYIFNKVNLYPWGEVIVDPD